LGLHIVGRWFPCVFFLHDESYFVMSIQHKILVPKDGRRKSSKRNSPTSQMGKKLKFPDIAEKAERFTVVVGC